MPPSSDKHLKYNISVAGAIAVVYLAELKFNVTGFPPVYLSSAAMVFAMCLNTYAIVKAVLSGPNPFGFASACGEFFIGVIILTPDI